MSPIIKSAIEIIENQVKAHVPNDEYMDTMGQLSHELFEKYCIGADNMSSYQSSLDDMEEVF